MFNYILNKVINKKNLTEEEMVDTMNQMMEGLLEPSQIGAFLTGLRMKGETLEEITGAAKVMRSKAKKIKTDTVNGIDTCGTGGDGANTFNISTASSIVAASKGVKVVKHGNRSVSSKSGSADVLEELGINIRMSVESIEKSIDQIGIGFLFAPEFHSSMKYAAGPRKALGVKTIFNILGPLTNPAGVENQLMGVFDENLTETLAGVLQNLGVKRAMVVHGMDGLDEITITSKTKVTSLFDGNIKSYYINPLEYGFNLADKSEIIGGNAKDNAKIIRDILNGVRSPKRDITVLNSAAVLFAGGMSKSMEDGIKTCEDAIDSGAAKQKLYEMVKFSKENAI